MTQSAPLRPFVAPTLTLLLPLCLLACASTPKDSLPRVFVGNYAIAVSENLELYAAPLTLEPVPGEPQMRFAQANFGLRVAKGSKAGALKLYTLTLWADLDHDGVWQAGEPRARQEGDLGLGSQTMQGILRAKAPAEVPWMLAAEVQHLSGQQSQAKARLTP